MSIMSDYEDAIESLEDVSNPIASGTGLRYRAQVQQWDPDQISLSSDVPGLHEVKVIILFAMNICLYYSIKPSDVNCVIGL